MKKTKTKDSLKQLKKYRLLSNILFPVCALVLCLMIIANSLLLSNYSLVSQFLNQPISKQVSKTTGQEVKSSDTKYFTSDYQKLKHVQKDETAYALNVQQEGSVLLQNNCLPLEEGSSVTLLGYSCTAENFLVGGGGSGSIDTSNTPSLKDVFEASGFQVNETMWDFYTSGDGKSSYNAAGITEPGQDKYTSPDIKASFKEYNDAAIVVFSRKGSEASDIAAGLLELSAEEKDLIAMAKENFSNVVLLLNTMNSVSLGEYEGDPQVSILWVGAGGQQGLRAIPDILNGQRVPSGHLTDTYAYDAYSAPAMVNFGNYQMTDSLGAYVNYAENIYIGYRYYETRYADIVTGRENVGEYDYNATVQYPFGYGLSYVDFDYSDFKVEDKGNTIDFTVTVTNNSNGELFAKDAVEIYMQSPYTEYDQRNGIEKAAIELVGFAKTAEIAPGMSDTVTVTVDKSCMRTYDAIGAKTYIVDEGDYYFALGTDAHEALNNILAAQGYSVQNGMTADGDATYAWKLTQNNLDTTTYAVGAGNTAITNQFDDASYSYFDDSFTYLSRSNWVGTWPTLLGNGELNPNTKIREAMEVVTVEDDPNATMPTTGANNDLTLVALMGKDYNDPEWDLLLDQMTADEMVSLITTAGYGNAAVVSVAKPYLLDKDGPAGISSTLIGGAGCFGFPTENLIASTWNVDIASTMGNFIGEDSLYSGVTGWYAPSMNIHRTAYSGRNFEYYSEDSYISGIFAAAVVKAASAKGVYCYIKHFALNDQETNRQLITTWANEQTIREIYLSPFETSVVEGGATAVMASMNRIGCIWSGASKSLMTNVLRNEWGFKGAVVTDAETAYNPNKDVRVGLAAGIDMYLCPTSDIWTIDVTNPTNMTMMRNACHDILYMVANSNAMNGYDADIRVVSVTPAWYYWLIAADVILAVLGLFALIFCTVNWAKASKKVKKGAN